MDSSLESSAFPESLILDINHDAFPSTVTRAGTGVYWAIMAEVAIEGRVYRYEAKPQPTANAPGKIVEAFGLGKCPKLAEQVRRGAGCSSSGPVCRRVRTDHVGFGKQG